MLNNKTILVTGGTGSWGNELVSQILDKFNPKEIRIYSRGEHRQVEMSHKFNDNRLRFIIGDVRDKNILDFATKNVDIIFHLAALKHVPVCENNTWEAVLTNVYGTQNVIECAIKNGVKKVVDISTDKAVEPFNHYGVTKSCGEKMIINANQNYQSDTKFVCIRGGNVLGTNGSVIPLFVDQIRTKNQITITDSTMTRYLMSTKQAIGLIFEAAANSVGGEIFVMRMPATKVGHIADVITKLFGDDTTEQKIIGLRPGEKIDEVLVSKNESPFTRIFNDSYYVILPQFQSDEINNNYENLQQINSTEFTSKNARQLDKNELEDLLKKEKWLWQ